MPCTRALYEFGDFVLDVGQQRLLRRDTGEAIPLTGRVFETLLCLVERAGETLDKDLLLRSIWPGVIVEENSLTQNVSTLRQALGETRGENRYIATVARRGYRFVARVTRRDEQDLRDTPAPGAAAPSAEPAAVRRTRFGAISAGAVLIVLVAAIGLFFSEHRTRTSLPVASQSLAILPFKPLLPAERNESLELGMTESLISSLGRYSPQAISPLSSVRRYVALNQDPIAAGRELGVATVLEGSLQRRGDRLRVSVRLLRVADGRQLWAQSFDQEFTTIFDVQDIIAARVAQSLAVRWAGSGSTRGAPYTQDPEAYALYASGRLAWTRQSEPSLRAARAIVLDPSLALTYHRRGRLYAMQGETERALAASERAQQLEPLWLWPRVAAADFLYYAGRYDESIGLLKQVLAYDDRADNARGSLVRNLIAKGDYDRALVEFDRRLLQSPGSN